MNQSLEFFYNGILATANVGITLVWDIPGYLAYQTLTLSHSRPNGRISLMGATPMTLDFSRGHPSKCSTVQED